MISDLGFSVGEGNYKGGEYNFKKTIYKRNLFNNFMNDMPKSVEKWYRLWISQFPESWHPSDTERFYMFVSVLMHNSRKPRTRYWLEKNMCADNPRLSEDDIENYCNLFEHLQNYSNVWKSQQAKQIGMDFFKADLEDRIQKRK